MLCVMVTSTRAFSCMSSRVSITRSDALIARHETGGCNRQACVQRFVPTSSKGLALAAPTHA